jgi:hypothetical protein
MFLILKYFKHRTRQQSLNGLPAELSVTLMIVALGKDREIDGRSHPPWSMQY